MLSELISFIISLGIAWALIELIDAIRRNIPEALGDETGLECWVPTELTVTQRGGAGRKRSGQLARQDGSHSHHGSAK